jgi:glycerol-3-phosphate dehydrogenase (NAD(P)+)
MKIVTMLGAGAFGTAVSTLLAESGYIVNLWCYEQEVVEQITNSRENKKFFPGFKLSSNIKPTTSLQEALKGSRFVFEAIPVKYLRKILNQAKDFVSKEQVFITLSKGLEQETLLLPTQIIDDVFEKKVNVASMAGPNFAKELAQMCCSAAVVGSNDSSLTQEIAKLLSRSYFKPYLSDDPIGIQVGGVVKNILTLLVGVSSGSVCGQNAGAFLLTRGFAEFAKLCSVLGGNENTVYGLSGLGDLILCTTEGSLSRNLKAGQMLGHGKNLDDVKKELHVLPEGVNSCESVYQLIQNNNLDLPICRGVYQIVFEGKTFGNFLTEIMALPLTRES